MLWTEKYQPQNSSELIGNELAIKKLHRLVKFVKQLRNSFESSFTIWLILCILKSRSYKV